MKDLLGEAKMEGFYQGAHALVHGDPGTRTKLILHADDGLLGSTHEERERLVAKLEEQACHSVTVQRGPHKDSGESELRKRRCVGTKEGVYMFSNAKHAEALIAAAGDKAKERDTPVDQSFLQSGLTKELEPAQGKLYKESGWQAAVLESQQA